MQDDFEYTVKTPIECDTAILKTFYDLVALGGKVSLNGLADRIKRCEFLAFCIDNNHIIGISAIKNPSENYKNNIITKHNIKRNSKELTFEIGYSFTRQGYRKKGISTKLKKKLLDNMINKSGIIFCTTAISSSQNFLIDNGFKNVGIPADGENDKNIKYYEKQL